MTKEQRDKICVTCKNHIKDERYGLLCGLTNNIANFKDTCNYYKKIEASNQTFNKPPQRFETLNRKKENGIGSLIGKGIIALVIFKIVIFIIKMIVNNN